MKYVIALLALIPSLAMAQYTQLSSHIDQSDGIVTFDQIDGLAGMDYEMYTGLTVLYDGLYLAVAASQTGVARGCTRTWFEVDGEQVPNSNILTCNPANQPLVGVTQGVTCLAEGQVVNVVIDGEIAAFFPDGEPVVPSIIATFAKIGDC